MSDAGLDGPFAAPARRPALRPAVRDGEDTATYAELGRRAETLAAQLRRTGAVPGDPVVVTTARSIGLAVAVLAVARIGAVFVLPRAYCGAASAAPWPACRPAPGQR